MHPGLYPGQGLMWERMLVMAMWDVMGSPPAVGRAVFSTMVGQITVRGSCESAFHVGVRIDNIEIRAS